MKTHSTRIGLGRGKGIGYKNLVPMDKYVHQLAGKGVKTYAPVMLNAREVVKRYKVYKFDELSPEAQRRAIEKYYDINDVDYQWWDYDGQLDLDPKTAKRYGLSVKESSFLGYSPQKMEFDLERGDYLKYGDLEVTNENAFRKFLGIPKPLWVKMGGWYRFNNSGRERDTSLEFEGAIEYTPKQQAILDNARERFSDLIHTAKKNLREQYEYLTSEEGIKETFEANNYEFNERGENDG